MKYFFSIFIGLYAFAIFHAHADEQSSGLNPLKPVKRFDVKYKYENLEHSTDAHEVTGQYTQQWQIKEELEFGLRVDLPWKFEHHNKDESGPDKFLLQGVAIQSDGEYRYGAGLRTITRSASEHEMSDENWDLAPILGGSIDIPELGHGSFIALVSRYRFSVTDAESRRDSNLLELEPILNIHLPDRWFLDIRFPSELDFENNNRWTLPLTLQFGRRIGDTLIVSVEPEFPLVDDGTESQFSVESRVGMFF